MTDQTSKLTIRCALAHADEVGGDSCDALALRILADAVRSAHKSLNNILGAVVPLGSDAGHAGVEAAAREALERLPDEATWLSHETKAPLTKRDGSWIDEWGACKVCDGELPHGHTSNCDLWKLEQEVSALQVSALRLRVSAQEMSASLGQGVDETTSAAEPVRRPEALPSSEKASDKDWTLAECKKHGRIYATWAGCSMCSAENGEGNQT